MELQQGQEPEMGQDVDKHDAPEVMQETHGPIRRMAGECRSLFQQAFSETGDEVSALKRFLDESSDRFEAWAAFLLVFGSKNACLDYRLRRHEPLKDMVMRLLDTLRRSIFAVRMRIKQGFGPDPASPSSPMSSKFPMLDACPSAVRVKCFGIQQSITSLNKLGVAIRASSRTPVNARARAFAASHNLNLAGYEQRSLFALRCLYPNAPESLRSQLVDTMADRYARLHYEAFRLDRPLLRPTPKSENPVSPPKVAEKITASTPDSLPKSDDPAPPSNTKPPTHAKVPVLPLSSINTKEVYARLDNPVPSRTNKTTTVGPQGLQEPEVPPPKNGAHTCSWCFQRIHPSWIAAKNGVITWTSAGRRHYRQDLKTYVCLAESCAASRPAFASYQEWQDHIRGGQDENKDHLHSDSWPANIHRQSMWSCQGPHEEGSLYVFASRQELYSHIIMHHGHSAEPSALTALGAPVLAKEHLKKAKDKAPTSTDGAMQKYPPKLSQLINRYSSELSRPPSACLLCGFDISGSGTDEIGQSSAISGPRRESAAKAEDGLPERPELGRHISGHLEAITILSLNLMAVMDGEFEDTDAESSADASGGASSKQPSSHCLGAEEIRGAQRCREALESLAFEQMGDRQMNIRRAHRKTCKWFRDLPEYADWQDDAKMADNNGVLWIKGKPGAGKSTLMKYLIDEAEKELGGSRVVSFFFNARGDELEKSTVGMYRHLIIQILQLQKMNDSDLATIWKRFIEDSGLEYSAAPPRWTVEILKDLFRAAVLGPGHRLACFVDALNECDEGEIRDMLDFFTELGELSLSQGTFRVCFASRHYPYITVDKYLEINLDVQSGHERDIVSYLETELKIGKNKTAKEVRAEILKSASGIFMWTVLTTHILNREFDHGNTHALKKKLKEIPKDLHTLFESILTRDEDNKAQLLLLCIQWTLYARRPLAPEELYFAIVPYDLEPGEVAIRHQPWDSEEITRDHMQRFIVSSSKGLVEITSTKKPTVQFIHESIRDYLFKGGLEKVWSDLKGDFGSISHDALKDGCLSYIRQGKFGVGPGMPSTRDPDAPSAVPDASIDLENSPDSPLETDNDLNPLAKTEDGTRKSKGGSVHRDRLCRTFPFLQYALRNVIYHSDRAQQGGICQLQFLQDFPKHQWVELDNAIAMYESRQHTKNVSLTYLLAEQNAASLIKASPNPLPYRHYARKSASQERYGAPLVAAIAHGSHEAIEQLLMSDADLSGFVGASFIDDTSAQAARGRQNLRLRWSPNHSMAYYLCIYGHSPFLKLLASAATKAMRQGALDAAVVEKNLLGTDVLELINGYNAFERQYPGEAAKAMISSGACQMPWYADGFRKFIAEAFLKGDLSCLKDGLDHGDDPSILAGHIWDWTYAWKTTIKKLIQDPSKLCQNLRLLVDAGYDVSALLDELVWQQVDASTSFLSERRAELHIWAAAGLGDKDVVIRLLDNGLDVNARDHFGRPALWYAARNGHKDLLEILLAERSADSNLIDLEGLTLLRRMTAFEGQVAIPVAKLIEYGAGVNAKDSDGNTPLHIYENRETCALLIQHGADINAKGKYGNTPLHAHKNQEICALLIQHGADVNAKNTSGNTPLHTHKNQEICALLIQHGADVNAKNYQGRTPLHVLYDAETMEFLCKNGADLEARDDDGYTPLLWHIRGNNKFAVDALLKRGARKDARSERGETAWELASRVMYGHNELLKLLGPEP